MNMKTKKTKLPRIIDKRKVAIVCVIVVVVLLFLNVSVRLNPFDGGGCFSVAFDKLPMLLADRAVIRDGENHYEINDFAFVKEITSATMCATNTDLCSHDTDRWIDIYCGNVLIRSMQWEANHNGIIVYQAGPLHWVFPSVEGKGIVYPSEEFIAKLEAVIQTSQ